MKDNEAREEIRKLKNLTEDAMAGVQRDLGKFFIFDCPYCRHKTLATINREQADRINTTLASYISPTLICLNCGKKFHGAIVYKEVEK